MEKHSRSLASVSDWVILLYAKYGVSFPKHGIKSFSLMRFYIVWQASLFTCQVSVNFTTRSTYNVCN